MQLAEADSSKKYDYIIVGGGVAGLCLAYQLVNSPLANRSILIIDQNAKERNDRTLSFWTDGPTPFDKAIHHSWNYIRFVSDNFSKKIHLEDYSYKTMHGIDFYQFVQETLVKFPNVAFLQARVESIENTSNGAYIYAGDQKFLGEWVFDSRLKPFEFKHKPNFGKQVLRQYFRGWVVETPEDTFDLECATLFDFRIPQENDMRFFYVLPFSKREALVEYVCLRRTDYEPIMKQYVEEVLKIKDYTAKPIEGGGILLTDRRFKRKIGAHIMSIGSAGGMIKPSSGYAFTRILKDTDAIVASLVQYGHPFKVPKVKPFYYFLDSQMIEAMNRFSGKMKAVFTGMFKYNPADHVFRFLDERASLWELAAMIISLPYKYLFIWTVVTDEDEEKEQAKQQNLSLKPALGKVKETLMRRCRTSL
jgi:lycopene beta-cyclase